MKKGPRQRIIPIIALTDMTPEVITITSTCRMLLVALPQIRKHPPIQDRRQISGNFRIILYRTILMDLDLVRLVNLVIMA